MPRRLAPDKIALLRQAYERGERVMEAARLACRGSMGRSKRRGERYPCASSSPARAATRGDGTSEELGRAPDCRQRNTRREGSRVMGS